MGSRATKRNSPIMIDNDPDNVPEGNQRRIEFLLVISQLPKISTNDLPALRKRFYDYLDPVSYTHLTLPTNSRV